MYKLFRQGLQSEYDAAVNKDSETLYFCTDTKRLYKGSDLYSKEIVFLPAGQTTANVAVKDIIRNVLYITTTGVISAYDGTEWKVLYDPSSNVQSDWKQNTDTAKDYIKNRTHYVNEDNFVLRQDEAIDLLSSNYSTGSIVSLIPSAYSNYGKLYAQTGRSSLVNELSGNYPILYFDFIDNRNNKATTVKDALYEKVNHTIDDIGGKNIKVNVNLLSVLCFEIYYILDKSTLNENYKSLFTSEGVFCKYISKPSYVKDYLKIYYAQRYIRKLDSGFLEGTVENTYHKVTSINSSSTDAQYPSAKAVYDAINTSLTNNQSDYIENNSASPSYIKNKPFTSLSSDFLVNNGLLSLSDTKIKSIQSLGIKAASANNFIRIKSVDSNNIPTGYESVDISNEFISAKGGSYTLDTPLNLSPSNPDTTLTGNTFYETKNAFIYNSADLTVNNNEYTYEHLYSIAGICLIRSLKDPASNSSVATVFGPNLWQLLDDIIDNDHRKLYVRAYGFELHRYDGGWKKNYISAEKDKLKIYNTQKLISFEGSRLENLGTPVNSNDGTTKKYVDDLIANTSKITLKTWTVADMT